MSGTFAFCENLCEHLIQQVIHGLDVALDALADELNGAMLSLLMTGFKKIKIFS